MNSNLNRGLASALAVFGSVAPALAQYDWDGHCIDTTSTAPYSADFNAYHMSTELFGAAIGISGTVSYRTASICGGGGSAPVIGRIGFTIGTRGSIQDNDPNQDFQGVLDDNMRLTYGTNFLQETNLDLSYPGPYLAPATGGFSFARIYQRDQTTGAVTNYLYGENGMRLAFIGRSGRYMYTESTVNGTDVNNSVGVRCVIDVVGDAARVNWRLTNRLNLNAAGAVGTAVDLGLYFGHTVSIVTEDKVQRLVHYGNAQNGGDVTYTTIPGRRPLTVEERFNATGLSPSNEQYGATVGVPPYVNFSASQVAGFGLQVVNSPSALAIFDPQAQSNGSIDQTQVDEFVFGSPGGVISGGAATTAPTIIDSIINPAGPSTGNQNADAAPVSGIPSFVQKWLPTSVIPTASRDIVAYYRSTNGDSSYGTSFTGYTAVVDTPKAISTVTGDPSDFTPNPFTIRVNVDNTGGFSTVDQFITMQSVAVTLTLPAGMHVPGNPLQTVITRTISTIGPASMGFVDFPVEVDPTTSGALTYTASISPQPGFETKTIRGTINVATTPRVRVDPGANLVGLPWDFADNSWETVLGLNLNSDFQAYTWDATTQQYIPQVAAERGRGTFIVSSLGSLGFRQLGGSPRRPEDQFPDPNNTDLGGAPIIQLHRGWNLVANPYNYAFDIGQIVGVPNGTSIALQYAELVNRGYTTGAFTYYDQLQKRYADPISGVGARLQPNRGYWLYANSDFALQFPPIFDLFVRSADAKPYAQRFDNWRLQLVAAQTGASDSVYVGTARKAEDAKNLSFLKAPISPAKNAIRSLALGDTQWGNAQLLRVGKGPQTFTYKVFNKQAGATTISWPNLKEIPNNLAVSIKDGTTGKTVNARSSAGYTYTSPITSERTFTVTVKPQATVAQRVGTASVSQVRKGPVQQMKISYTLGGRGSATLRVYDKSRRLVGLAANDVDAVAGANVVTWPMVNLQGLPLDAGNYTLEIAATGEGGDTATRQLAITIRR